MTIKCVPQQILFSGFGGRKAPSSMGKISTAGVLRLRATSAVSRDKSVRRSAQDDDFVGGLTKNIRNKLTLVDTALGYAHTGLSKLGFRQSNLSYGVLSRAARLLCTIARNRIYRQAEWRAGCGSPLVFTG